MTLRLELIDELLKEYRNPEDHFAEEFRRRLRLIGILGIFKAE